MRELCRTATRVVRTGLIVLLVTGAGTRLLARKPAAESDEGAALRLVVEIRGHEFDRFEIKDEALAVLDAERRPAPPGRRTWRLEGDLAATAALLRFSPEYAVLPRDPLCLPAPGGKTSEARITLSRTEAVGIWKPSALARGLLVAAWLVDGRVSAVEPVPLADDTQLWNSIGIVMDLTAEQHRGMPALLLWKSGAFIPPEPLFKAQDANAAVIALHLGTDAECEAAIAAVKDCLVRQPGRGATLLHVASGAGRVVAVNALLARGVPASLETAAGSPLRWTIPSARTDALAALAAAGGWKSQSPIKAAEQAVARGHVDLVVSLLDQHSGWKPWPHVVDSLAEQAARQGRLDIITRLADLDRPSALKQVSGCALVARAQAADHAALALLLRHGANPARDLEGTTALHAAARRGHVAIARLLIDHKAPIDAIDRDGRTPLLLAARNGHSDLVRVLLDNGAATARADPAGLGPLHYAVLAGNADCVGLLLTRGARADQGDGRDTTPLDLALRLRARDSVEQLAASGAPFSFADDATLEGAIALDRADLLDRAAQQGWDATKPLPGGWSPAAVARHFNARQVRGWLRERVAGTTASAPLLAQTVDTAPALHIPAVSEWFAGGFPRRATDLAVRIVCVIDAEGRVILPSLPADTPADVVPAILANVPAWQGKAATSAAKPVSLLSAITCTVPAADPHVYSACEVDTPPVRLAGETLSTQLQSVLEYRGNQYHTIRSVSGTGAVSFTTVATPQYDTVVAPSEIEDAVAAFIVEPDGSVTDVSLISHRTRTAEPQRVILGWKFAPALRSGVPVRMRMTTRLSSAP